MGKRDRSYLSSENSLFDFSRLGAIQQLILGQFVTMKVGDKAKLGPLALSPDVYFGILTEFASLACSAFSSLRQSSTRSFVIPAFVIGG